LRLTLFYSCPDFLRLSRATIDDSITQHLNALITPASAGFNPAAPPNPLAGRRTVDAAACQRFRHAALFPSWQARSDVLNYCAGVATSPDPDDPDLLLREVESARDRERVVDERLDPYSARFFPREARTELLALTIRNERGVENIVRNRTWAVMAERCAGVQEAKWEDALDRWRREQESRPRK
jgi:hypothetical protein